MRTLLIAMLLTGHASADVGVGLFAQATRYADQPNGNIGAAAELSIDRGRFQYLAELAIAGVSFGDGSWADGLAGTMYRGAVGVRYRARRFSLPVLDIDLGFEAIAAMQDIEWSDRDAMTARTVRPELDLGWAWNFVYDHKIGFRTSLRAFFVPSPTQPIACRGTCPTNDAITSGFMVVTGVTW
jgi:hypothetical protein